MLTGEFPKEPLAARIAASAVLMAFLIPWFLIGGGMLLVGMVAIGPRKQDLAELWICIPAGLAVLLGLATLLYYVLWHMPQQTVSRFEFDGDSLTIETEIHGVVTRPISELQVVKEQFGRHSRGLMGWWLKIEGAGWVFLSRKMPHANALMLSIKG